MRKFWVYGMFVLATINTVTAAECNKVVQPISTNEFLAYQDRGDRCEGLYEQPVANTGLRIAAFLGTRIKKPNISKSIKIVTQASSAKTLLVTTTRRRLYYRMDADFDGKSFEYPSTLLTHEDIAIKPEELSPIICVENCRGLQPVLVPAIIGDAKDASSWPFILLQATSKLNELNVEISAAASGKMLLERQYLKIDSLDPWEPFKVPLKSLFTESKELIFKATAKGEGVSQSNSVHAILRLAPNSN